MSEEVLFLEPLEDPISIQIGQYRTVTFSLSYIKTIAEKLRLNDVTFVELQPGDATRYLFYIIPQVDDYKLLYRFGASRRCPWRDDKMVWIAPVNLGTNRPGDIVCLAAGDQIYYDLMFYTNPHTLKVLTVFLDLVYQALRGVENFDPIRFMDKEES